MYVNYMYVCMYELHQLIICMN